MCKRFLFLLIIVFIAFLFSSCKSDSSTSPTTDNETPVVAFTNIHNGDLLTGTFIVNVDATDNSEIEKVALYIDSLLIAEDNPSRSTSTFTLTCSDYTDGEHLLQAKAWDASGNIGETDIFTIEISSQSTDNETPVVTFTNIHNGDQLTGTFIVNVDATDNSEIEKVALYIDSLLIAEDNPSRSTSTFTLSCSDFTDGDHLLQAKAWDASGNIGETDIFTIETSYQPDDIMSEENCDFVVSCGCYSYGADYLTELHIYPSDISTSIDSITVKVDDTTIPGTIYTDQPHGDEWSPSYSFNFNPGRTYNFSVTINGNTTSAELQLPYLPYDVVWPDVWDSSQTLTINWDLDHESEFQSLHGHYETTSVNIDEKISLDTDTTTATIPDDWFNGIDLTSIQSGEIFEVGIYNTNFSVDDRTVFRGFSLVRYRRTGSCRFQ